MAENLPRLREEIKEISMSDLKDFLESIRKHSDKVGEAAMRQVWGFDGQRFLSVIVTHMHQLNFLCDVTPGTAAQELQQCGSEAG